jgi:hypothetical protein
MPASVSAQHDLRESASHYLRCSGCCRKSRAVAPRTYAAMHGFAIARPYCFAGFAATQGIAVCIAEPSRQRSPPSGVAS